MIGYSTVCCEGDRRRYVSDSVLHLGTSVPQCCVLDGDVQCVFMGTMRVLAGEK